MLHKLNIHSSAMHRLYADSPEKGCFKYPNLQGINWVAMGDYQYKIVVEAGYLTVPDFSCWTKPLLIHDNWEVNGV